MGYRIPIELEKSGNAYATFWKAVNLVEYHIWASRRGGVDRKSHAYLVSKAAEIAKAQYWLAIARKLNPR